jgi:hypothetical protein
MSNLDRYNRSPSKPAPAIRSVPLSAKLAVLFGGALQPLGWLIFGFTMIFVWIFGFNADYRSLLQFRGELAQASATVTGSERTSFSEGGSNSRPGTPIFRVSYEFKDAEGVTRGGTSYTRGERHRVGAAAPVEFVPGKPEVSRIQGARTAPFGAGVMFIFLFPLVGLLMIFGGLSGGLVRAALLTRGKLSRGWVKDKQATSSRVNNEIVYRVTLEFETEDGKAHTFETRTHKTHLLEDEENGELILYHPANPKLAYPVDLMPAGVRITEEGEYKEPPKAYLLLAIVPPLVVIAGHSIYAAIAFL